MVWLVWPVVFQYLVLLVLRWGEVREVRERERERESEVSGSLLAESRVAADAVSSARPGTPAPLPAQSAFRSDRPGQPQRTNEKYLSLWKYLPSYNILSGHQSSPPPIIGWEILWAPIKIWRKYQLLLINIPAEEFILYEYSGGITVPELALLTTPTRRTGSSARLAWRGGVWGNSGPGLSNERQRPLFIY